MTASTHNTLSTSDVPIRKKGISPLKSTIDNTPTPTRNPFSWTSCGPLPPINKNKNKLKLSDGSVYADERQQCICLR